jgi:serine/threonine protein phosphatase PrpC
MEDAHTAILDMLAASGEPATKATERLSFFGVFDGHGGDKVALFAGENIHQIVKKQGAFKEGDYEKALKDGFLATDRAILDGKHRYSAPAALPETWNPFYDDQCHLQRESDHIRCANYSPDIYRP